MNTRKIVFLSVAISLVCANGCRVAMEETSERSENLVFRASWADSDNTRTVLRPDGTSVWWTPFERISVFHGDMASGCFTSTNVSPASLTTFQGTLSYNPGVSEWMTQSSQYWGVYPYRDGNRSDGTSVTLHVPSYQQGVAGTFDDGLFPAVAASWNDEFAFYHACGGARFSVVQEGITSVCFKSVDGSPMAGTIRFSFDPDGVPMVTPMSETVDSVLVVAPEGGFIPGQFYFATMIPQMHPGGLTIRMKQGDKTGLTSVNHSITVHRSRFGKLNELDKDVVFQEGTVPEVDPSANIEFADKGLKAFLVSAFDTNGDSEISYGEAAAVKTLGNLTVDYCTASSFDEFRFFTGITEILSYQFSGWDRMVSITLPESIRTIGAYAFRGCSSLLSLAIPENVSEIGDMALSGCHALASLSIGKCFNKTLARLGLSYSTGSLSTVTLLPGIIVIPSKAFYNWSKLTSVVIPDSVTYIGDQAFYGCSGLEEIALPPLLTSISRGLFQSCKSLKSLVIPEGVSEIVGESFRDCERLTSIVIPDSVTKMGGYSFTGTALTHVDLPKKLTGLSDCLFAGCESLQSISVPESVVKISHAAFKDCSGLTSVDLPESLLVIELEAFKNCVRLREIQLPSRLSSLGDDVFTNCSSLISIAIPDSVTSLGQSMFKGCTSLTAFSLPSGCESVPDYFFMECNRLQQITIPEGVRRIGIWAFSGSGVVSISFPESLTGIGDSAFGRCSSLTSVSFPSEVTSISDNAFRACSSLREVQISKSESPLFLGCMSFGDCPALSSFMIDRSSPPDIIVRSNSGETSFSGSDLCRFYVPADAVETYRSREGWRVFADRILPVTELE